MPSSEQNRLLCSECSVWEATLFLYVCIKVYQLILFSFEVLKKVVYNNQYKLHSIDILLELVPFPQGSTGHHCPVRKSGKFSKSGLTKNRTFSFPDAGLLSLEKMGKKSKKNPKKKNFKNFFQNFFQDFFLFIYLVWDFLTPNLCSGTLSYEK